MVRRAEAHVERLQRFVTLHAYKDRIPPVRGLVLAHARDGRPVRAVDVARWLRLNRVVYKSEKVDLLLKDACDDPTLDRCLDKATELDLHLSLRTECSAPAPDFARLKEQGLFDVLLTPGDTSNAPFQAWFDGAANARLPIRLQLPPPLDVDGLESEVQRFRDHGVVSVNIAAFDPVGPRWACADGAETRRSLHACAAMIKALEAESIEANIVRIPFCLFSEDLYPNVVDAPQFFLDHQQYIRDAYETARQLTDRSPAVVGKVVQMLLARHTLLDDPIDRKLLPWILEKPWLRARVVAWHRLTRHRRLTHSLPKPTEDSVEAYEAAVQEKLARQRAEAGPVCGRCRLQAICDRDSKTLRRALPGIKLEAKDGPPVMYPMHYAVEQKKYYDAVDSTRVGYAEDQVSLAAKANDLVANVASDREIDSFAYALEGQWCHQLPGGVRWFGFTNTEKLSTPLAKLNPPFTLSAVFGGGIAEYIGFALGRESRLLCPMEATRHQLVLHVEADGRYVLLRDGLPVRPVSFAGAFYAPLRVGDAVEPRLAAWNIDSSIVTQNVSLWTSPEMDVAAQTKRFSIVTVCVRYARRLEAVLQCVAHQRDIDLRDIEMIVAYVPGVDATEDVLENLKLAHPDLNVVRSTFAEEKANAKGFVINESLKKARGDWVMLLDADTLIPPDMFLRMQPLMDASQFIVPDGRKLLDKETTAKVLLGEIRPWERWDELLQSAGEFRYREMDGVPIGFCQCVRRDAFQRVAYYEADHFEGADWQFSVDMRKEFGEETRLTGVPVLHLDHGGSKWYGTRQHY